MIQNSQQNGAFDEQMKTKRLIRKFGVGEMIKLILLQFLFYFHS